MVRALFLLLLQNMQSSEPGHSSIPCGALEKVGVLEMEPAWSSPGHPELCLACGTCPTNTERCQDRSPLCAHSSCSDSQLTGGTRPGRGKREGLVQSAAGGPQAPRSPADPAPQGMLLQSIPPEEGGLCLPKDESVPVCPAQQDGCGQCRLP